LYGKLEARVGIFVLAAVAVFLYMGFHVGAFRFDRGRYHTYILHFTDVSGLSRKADIKIAGVKVGWVEDVELLREHGHQKVSVEVSIQRNYALYADAHGIVRQDGLLGVKFVEIIPGDPLLPRLQSGSALKRQGPEPVAVDSILKQFNDIAASVREVAGAFKEAACANDSGAQLCTTFQNVHLAAERLATFAQRIDDSLSRNGEQIEALLQAGASIRELTQQLSQTTIPAVQDSITRVTNTLEQNIQQTTDKVSATIDSFDGASAHARNGLHDAVEVARKINAGEGTLGKLICSDEPYRDVQEVTRHCRECIARLGQVQFVSDAHLEWMLRRGENYPLRDSKGYVHLRIHPCENYFLLAQLTLSERGYIWRDEVQPSYCNPCSSIVDTSGLMLTDAQKLEFVYRCRHERYRRNSVKLGLQLARVFSDFIALRFGLFEGFIGVGLDIDLPLPTDRIRWVTTLELFDMKGWNRHNDRMPHAKWLNRMFIMDNVYAVFGADDFASRCNASAFLGLGLRFGGGEIGGLFSTRCT